VILADLKYGADIIKCNNETIIPSVKY
jgi:hypothetical protein